MTMTTTNKYLDAAKERIPNVPMLINVVARRVRQLNAGHRPLVKPDTNRMQKVDIALKEIAEGKLTAEVSFTPPPVYTSSSTNLLSL